MVITLFHMYSILLAAKGHTGVPDGRNIMFVEVLEPQSCQSFHFRS